jgi:hypothetical protein
MGPAHIPTACGPIPNPSCYDQGLGSHHGTSPTYMVCSTRTPRWTQDQLGAYHGRRLYQELNKTRRPTTTITFMQTPQCSGGWRRDRSTPMPSTTHIAINPRLIHSGRVSPSLTEPSYNHLEPAQEPCPLLPQNGAPRTHSIFWYSSPASLICLFCLLFCLHAPKVPRWPSSSAGLCHRTQPSPTPELGCHLFLLYPYFLARPAWLWCVVACFVLMLCLWMCWLDWHDLMTDLSATCCQFLKYCYYELHAMLIKLIYIVVARCQTS